MHACTHTHTHTHIYARTHIHTYTHTYIHTYIHTCMHAYIHTCICVYVRLLLRKSSIHWKRKSKLGDAAQQFSKMWFGASRIGMQELMCTEYVGTHVSCSP